MSVQELLARFEVDLGMADLGAGQTTLRELCRHVPTLLSPADPMLLREATERLSLAVDKYRKNAPLMTPNEYLQLGELVGVCRVLGAAATDAPSPIIMRELANRATQEIVETLLKTAGEIGTTDLASALGKDAGGVSRTLKRMEDAGVVTHRQEGRSKLWSVTHPAREAWEKRDDVRDGSW